MRNINNKIFIIDDRKIIINIEHNNYNIVVNDHNRNDENLHHNPEVATNNCFCFNNPYPNMGYYQAMMNDLGHWDDDDNPVK